MTPGHQDRTDEVYLEDILEAAQSAREFIAGLSREEFLADRKTIFAVARALEIIGEATRESRKISKPGIPPYPGESWQECVTSSLMTTSASIWISSGAP